MCVLVPASCTVISPAKSVELLLYNLVTLANGVVKLTFVVPFNVAVCTTKVKSLPDIVCPSITTSCVSPASVLTTISISLAVFKVSSPPVFQIVSRTPVSKSGFLPNFISVFAFSHIDTSTASEFFISLIACANLKSGMTD